MLSIQPFTKDISYEYGKGCEDSVSLSCGYIPKRVQEAKHWARDTCLRAYPSPPMSGSLPATSAGAIVASTTSQPTEDHPARSYQHAVRNIPNQEPYPEEQDRQYPAVTTAQIYHPEPSANNPFGFQRPGLQPGRPVSYPQVLSRGIDPQHYGNQPPGIGYPVIARPQTMEHPPYTSPKSQRKTKGHVASACVPCKKAHLR